MEEREERDNWLPLRLFFRFGLVLVTWMANSALFLSMMHEVKMCLFDIFLSDCFSNIRVLFQVPNPVTLVIVFSDPSENFSSAQLNFMKSVLRDFHIGHRFSKILV